MSHPSPVPRTPRSPPAARGATAIGVAGAVIAAPATAAPPTAGAPSATAAAPVTEHTVTLITGDRVHVTTLADGHQVVDVETVRPGAGYRALTIDDDVIVIPRGVERYLAADVVDLDLFNVTRLIEYGYDDAHVDATPIIVELASGPRTFRSALPGVELGVPLESIGGAAATADHEGAAATWAALTAAPAARAFGAEDVRLGGGVEAIHLDGKVKATLDSSVGWTGAPEAWAEGFTGEGVTVAVLDTGYDDTHPDLEGRVLAESTSFVPGEEVAHDPQGHGTHVASTIAGTGAGDGGIHRGVADGTDLLIGKVLDETGYGQDSWIIAGMEWAAEHAPVVSMSLGSLVPSDGTDVMSLALDEIAEETGALFVVAAGNSAAPQTVSSPGAARAALTVGSVDDPSGQLSWFSSQGPLTLSGSMKPDLAGPGSDVSAARSADSPGEGLYVSMSGTSMATPHVAGAAAIVRQQHPDYSADQLRAALLSSASDLGLTSYQAGAGVLDVAAAVDAPVVASGSGDFGLLSWGEDPTPVERTIDYANRTGAEVTIDLSATLTDVTWGGSGGDSSGAVTVSADSLTIPAGESRSITVTGDPAAVPPGTEHSGSVVASIAGEPVARTALGLLAEAERYDLTFTTTGFDGEPIDTYAVIYNSDDGAWDVIPVSGERTIRLPKGRWSVSTFADLQREPDTTATVYLGDPEIILDRDQTVALDARSAVPISVDVGQEGLESILRRMDVTVDGFGNAVLAPVWIDELWAMPAGASDAVRFDFTTRWRLVHERLGVTIGKEKLDLIPQAGSTPLDGSLKASVVDAGDGSTEALEAAGARGKVVVVTRSADVTPMQQAANAVEGGAVMLIISNSDPGEFSTWVGSDDYESNVAIPVASISGVQGEKIRAMLAERTLKAVAEGEPYSTEVWDIGRYLEGTVPSDLAYRPADLARVDTTFYGDSDDIIGEMRWDIAPSGATGFALPLATRRGMERTDWIDTSMKWYQEATTVHGGWQIRDVPRSYEPGGHARAAFFGPIVRPYVGEGFWAPARSGSSVSINIPSWADGGDPVHTGTMDVFSPEPTATVENELHVDGELVKTSPFPDLNYWEMPDGTSELRIVSTAEHDGSATDASTRSVSEWEVTSTGSAEDWTRQFLPMLQAAYDVELDETGVAGAGRQKGAGMPLSLEIGHIAGAAGSAAVASATLEARVAGGDWVDVPLTLVSRDTSGPGAEPDGIFPEGRAWIATYAAVLPAPDAGAWVDLRLAAEDEAGNTYRQEVERALEIAPAKGAKPRG